MNFLCPICKVRIHQDKMCGGYEYVVKDKMVTYQHELMLPNNFVLQW